LALSKLAFRGAPEGLAIVAREQDAGIGRHGRRWVSPKGGLYASVLLRPGRSTGLPLLTLVGALAVIEGVRKDTGVVPRLRWPNDVTYEGKKLGGVIAEASFTGQQISYVVLGFGVNCNFSARRLGSLRRKSTTLFDVLGVRIDLPILGEKILETFSHLYSLWVDSKDDMILSKVRLALSTVGKRVLIKTGRGTIKGLVLTMNKDGSLSLKVGRTILVVRSEDIETLTEL
jgi:BirA family biotin operon repressor/biotin-[acetyl-CoA-carboxylase] ligase